MKMWVLVPAAVLSLSFSSGAAINSESQNILRMVNQGVSQDVVQQYINGQTATFNLNADDILYLQQSGVPQPVISTMISHDNAIAQNPQSYSTQPNPSYAEQQNYQQAPVDQSYQSSQQVNPPDAYVSQDQQVVQVAPQQAPPQVTSFYDDLRPYGNWIYLEGSGWCWQPTVVRTEPNWQPYCDNGSWLYCNDGWYWQSYYNWGWAPFHYGRWAHANCGWVWYPDTVWAPSWVCWRNNGDYCGWAPLPPSGFGGYGRAGFHFGVDFNVGLGAGLFTFIHLGDIFHGEHGHGYRNHQIPRTQVTQIYNRTRVINNVTVVNNNYARNPGISRQTVERVTGPVHVAPVRTTREDPRVSRAGVVNSGSQVAIVRPERAPTPTRTTPVVGHRVSANARTVPATAPTIHQTRNTSPAQNGNRNATTSGQPLRSPKTTDYNRNNTTRATEPPRNPSSGPVPRTSGTTEGHHTTTPRVNEAQHATNPQGHTAPRTTEKPRVTETPQTTAHPSEVPKPAPHVAETPKPAPHPMEVPKPAPNITKTPKQAPHVTETPKPTPHVTEVPKPAPHVTEVPHATPARPATPAQPEVHRAYPQTAPRVQAPTVHEPAGAPRTPTPAPQVQAPVQHSTPHVSTPPALPPTPAPAVEHHSAPPVVSHGNPGHSPDGRQDH